MFSSKCDIVAVLNNAEDIYGLSITYLNATWNPVMVFTSLINQYFLPSNSCPLNFVIARAKYHRSLRPVSKNRIPSSYARS